LRQDRAAGPEAEEDGEEKQEEEEDAQPGASSLLSPARLAALQAAVPTRVFQSHWCAPAG